MYFPRQVFIILLTSKRALQLLGILSKLLIISVSLHFTKSFSYFMQ